MVRDGKGPWWHGSLIPYSGTLECRDTGLQNRLTKCPQCGPTSSRSRCLDKGCGPARAWCFLCSFIYPSATLWRGWVLCEMMAGVLPWCGLLGVENKQGEWLLFGRVAKVPQNS